MNTFKVKNPTDFTSHLHFLVIYHNKYPESTLLKKYPFFGSAEHTFLLVNLVSCAQFRMLVIKAIGMRNRKYFLKCLTSNLFQLNLKD